MPPEIIHTDISLSYVFISPPPQSSATHLHCHIQQSVRLVAATVAPLGFSMTLESTSRPAAAATANPLLPARHHHSAHRNDRRNHRGGIVSTGNRRQNVCPRSPVDGERNVPSLRVGCFSGLHSAEFQFKIGKRKQLQVCFAVARPFD